jgi:lysophospholipase L1-like esterase
MDSMHHAVPMALTAAAVVLLISGSACNHAAPGPSKMVRFLALGDSYTIGEGVAEGERWPMLLADILKTHGYLAQVRIVARTGWTTDELGRVSRLPSFRRPTIWSPC